MGVYHEETLGVTFQSLSNCAEFDRILGRNNISWTALPEHLFPGDSKVCI
jgi:hypothetical protein